VFLSAEQVADLTGRTQPAAQRRWLTRNGVRFFVRADGRPAVPADQLQPPGTRRPAGPNLEALARLV
jgi:hypothetical protein